MLLSRTAALAAVALLPGVAPAAAQQVFTAPGVTIIVSPGQPGAPDAFEVMDAQMAQMDAMMRQMDAQMGAQLAAMPAAAEVSLPAGATGVAVTTISDGSRTCTARVVYSGGGAAQVSETGNDCSALHLGAPGGPVPVALPAAPVRQKAPSTIVVRNDSRNDARHDAAAPVLLADRD